MNLQGDKPDHTGFARFIDQYVIGIGSFASECWKKRRRWYINGIGNLISPYKDFFHSAPSRIINNYEISPTPRGQCSPIGQPEPFCSRKRRHTQCKFRFEPTSDSLPYTLVNMSLLKQRI